MKRLIRKAIMSVNDEDLSKAEEMIKELDEYVQGYYDGMPNIEYMLFENPDCKYSGILYRCVFLDDDFIDDIKNQSFPIDINQVLEIAKQHMYKSYSYCSFTKYQGVADTWMNENNDLCITIKTDNEGLDVVAMTEKWENYISEDYMEYLQLYARSESEVICPMKYDFEIVSLCGQTILNETFENSQSLLEYFNL